MSGLLLDRLVPVSDASREDPLVRELQRLLGTFTSFPAGALEDFPEVQKSVVNYGLEGVDGLYENPEDQIGEAIRVAIGRFEPRLRVSAVVPRRRGDETTGRERRVGVAGFVIEASPVERPGQKISIAAEVDFEELNCTVQADAPRGNQRKAL